MKEGRIYKELGDICEVEYGTRVVQARDGGSVYPVYGGGGATFMMDTFNREDRVVVSRFAMSPKCTRSVTGKFFLNDSGLTLKSTDSVLSQEYLDSYILSNNDKIYTLGRGLAQKNLKVEDLLKLQIYVPSQQQQNVIVSELNNLNKLIALKKKQIEDLETLSQSIFYEMFGDPVENEKGWATEVIGKIAPCVSYKGEIVSKEGKYWLLNLDMVESMTGRVIDRKYVEKSKIGNSTFTFNEDNVLYSKLRPYLNKVVIPNGNGYCTSELLPLLPDKKHLNRIFLAFVLRNKSFVDFINIKVAGAKMPRVSMTDFRNFKLILPPLPLQQTFAERISAIEQQKLQISSTIKDLETLLASRMQYWFD